MPGIPMGKINGKSRQRSFQNKSKTPLNHSKEKRGKKDESSKKNRKDRRKSVKMACLSDLQWNINKFQNRLKGILKANTPIKKIQTNNPVTINNNTPSEDFIPLFSSNKNSRFETPGLYFNRHLTSSTPHKKSSTEANQSTASFSLFSPIVSSQNRPTFNNGTNSFIPVTDTISLDDDDSQCFITIDRVGMSTESCDAPTVIDLDSTEFNETVIPNTAKNKKQIENIKYIDLTDTSTTSMTDKPCGNDPKEVDKLPPIASTSYDLTGDDGANDIKRKTSTVDMLAQGMLGQCYQPSNSVSGFFGTNIYCPKPDGTKKRPTGLRMVVIDGSNVAMQRTHGKFFSTEALKICIDYFLKRGHVVKAFVPRFRNKNGKCSNPKLLQHLEKEGHVVYTPSRTVRGKIMNSYDDRFIVQCAASFGGVIVSCDDYRDIMMESESLRETIENRLLPFTWVDDMIMFPQDPLGKNGPKLDTFLRHP